MRKFLFTILSVILLVCAGSAVACSKKNADYYSIIFRKANGITYVSDINSGKGFTNGTWDVKDGATVSFKIELASDAVGEAVVYSNGETLDANGSGAYSVKVTKNTEITVGGIEAVGDYNRISVPATDGVAVTFLTSNDEGETLKNGMMVRSGMEVSFIVTVSDGYYGTPVVYANADLLTPSNDKYTFVMNKPTTIKVEGIEKNISLTFSKGDTRVDYIGIDGLHFDTDVAIPMESGDEVVFDLKISVYYNRSGKYEVLANTTIISPKSDGHYHVVIEEETVIMVSGLEEDEMITEGKAFRGEGNGTKEDPYRLSRPVDLYLLATLVNNDFYLGAFGNSYYVLENDIDLEEEQLYVIGDGSGSYASFSGHFDGKGHKISNFYITDTRIDQEEYNRLYLTSVGMFGYVMPGTTGAPEIKNLTLDNFRITASGSRSTVSDDYALCVGSLAGTSYGASISGVSAKNGLIEVTGGRNSGSYVGGLIGQQLSGYSSLDGNKYDSGVISCMTGVDISITADNSSYVFATGGISGAMSVGDEHYTAYILNSYSTGSIVGGQHAGGIVGYMYNHSAVANCYSTGSVRANITLASGYLDSAYRANAGGLVGYAEYSTVISNSFSTGTISAQSSKGESYCKASGTVANTDTNLIHADALAPTLINLYGKETSVATIISGLGWSDKDWDLTGDLPKLKPVTVPAVTVKFSVDGSLNTLDAVSLNGYKSLAGWDVAEIIPEFVTIDKSLRSYGYYFDEELENKVPRSFVLTSDMTLYVGCADYSEVEGVYYLGDSPDSVTLELTADGVCVYRDGALNQTSVYSWDGENLILYYSVVGVLTKVDIPSDLYGKYFEDYYIFNATNESGVLTIYGGAVYELDDEDYYTGEVFYLFPEGQPLNGYKHLDSFKYGSYYFNGGEYYFFGNRTGLYVPDNGDEVAFTYEFNGDKLNLTFDDRDGTKEEATLNGAGYVTQIKTNAVTAYDEFKGVWEKSYSTEKKYTFDGKGGWSYDGYDSKNTGTYSIEGGVLADDSGAFEATLADGLLEVTNSGKKVTYYREGSFAGGWYFNGLTAEGGDIAVGLTLDGIGLNGYGYAHVEYSTGTSYEITYEYLVENNVKYLLLFYRDLVFGELVYSDVNLTLVGTINGHYARFTAYDSLHGLWFGDGDEISSAEFNGNGFYNGVYELDGERVKGSISVRGSVRINGDKRVNYFFDRKTLTGSFTYNGKDYEIIYHESENRMELNADGGSTYLELPDAWYGRSLIDGEGNIYSFDGKGNLPSGGKIKVSGGGEYSYKIEDGNIVLTGSETMSLGKDDKDNAVYVLNAGGSTKYLTLNTPFTGEWIIGGLGGTLSIGKIFADNTASGSYTLYKQSAKAIALTYNPDGNYLTYEENGKVYRITAAAFGSNYQLTFGGTGAKCIPADLADELAGKAFKVLDENGEEDGSLIVFDGLGEYAYSNGSAVVVNSDGKIDRTLIYGKNYYGDWIIISSFYNYLLVACEKDTKFEEVVLFRLKDDNNNYFAVISPDGLYKIEVKDADESGAKYIFNGHGEVKHVASDGTVTVYNYKIKNFDSTTFKHSLEFTANNGDKFTVILDLSNSDQNKWNISKAE